MDDDTFRLALADRFTSSELIEYLGVDVQLIIELFIDEIYEVRNDLTDFLNHGR